MKNSAFSKTIVKNMAFSFAIVLAFLTCSKDENMIPEPTVSELLEGKWQLLAVQGPVFGWETYEGVDSLPPLYSSIIEFKLENIEIEHEEYGIYTENGKLHFIYGNITGDYETITPSAHDTWSLSWIVFESSMLARYDPWGFDPAFNIIKISEDSLTLEQEVGGIAVSKWLLFYKKI